MGVLTNSLTAAAWMLWENDTESPFPDENGNATMPCCSHPDFMPGEEDYANAEKEWREAGLITE